MLNWRNAVMHLVFTFRILPFHSPSEYVKDGSLYITNYGLNFKALDKNDLTLYLWMSLLSHPSVVSMGTNVHQRRKREKETVRQNFQSLPRLSLGKTKVSPMLSAD